jgi:hypothetical protein
MEDKRKGLPKFIKERYLSIYVVENIGDFLKNKEMIEPTGPKKLMSSYPSHYEGHAIVIFKNSNSWIPTVHEEDEIPKSGNLTSLTDTLETDIDITFLGLKNQAIKKQTQAYEAIIIYNKKLDKSYLQHFKTLKGEKEKKHSYQGKFAFDGI